MLCAVLFCAVLRCGVRALWVLVLVSARAWGWWWRRWNALRGGEAPCVNARVLVLVQVRCV